MRGGRSGQGVGELLCGPCVAGELSEDKIIRLLKRLWETLVKEGNAGLTVGLDDLTGLFQP